MAEDHDDIQRVPTAGVAAEEINRLFRNVGIPDEHVLAEADVGPENGEGQHQLAHDVVVLDRHHALQVTRAAQGGDQKDEHAHRTERRPRKDVNPPHRREPVEVEAHQPVERPEGQGQREQGEHREDHLARGPRVPRVAILVLPHRIAAQEEGRRAEKEEIKPGPGPEERFVQIRRLAVEQNILARRDIHPFEKCRRAENDRDEQDGQDREKPGHVFQLPPHHHAPIGINRMVDQNPKQRTGQNGEEETESEKPGEGELLGRKEASPRGQGQRGDGQRHGEKQFSTEPLVIEVFLRAHFAFGRTHGCGGISSLARSSAGTSLIVAVCAICSART